MVATNQLCVNCEVLKSFCIAVEGRVSFLFPVFLAPGRRHPPRRSGRGSALSPRALLPCRRRGGCPSRRPRCHRFFPLPPQRIVR